MNPILKNTIAIILFVLSGCNDLENKKTTTLEVIYKAETRGSSIGIHYKDNSISLKENNNDKLITLSNTETKKINELVQKINLSEMESLVAPSNKRFSDGALSANFTIKKDTKMYMSSGFDHGNPPNELKNLYFLLEKYSK